MDSESIRHQAKPFPQEVTDTVRNDAISFHFTKSQTSRSTSTMSWLPCNGHNRTSRPSIHLIIDQMSQSLVVNWTNENKVLKFLATVRVEHDLISVLLVARFMNLHSLLLKVESSERSSVLLETTLKSSHLTDKSFDDVTDCHSGGDTVRIDDHVWDNTIHCER